MPRRSAVGTVIGALNVLTGALMMWGGAREVETYLGADAWAAGIGALGFMAGAAFAASGVALLLALPVARRLLTAGALGSAVVHGAGVATGLIGIPGLILGVGYPLLAWIAVRRPPSGTDEVGKAEAFRT